MAAFSPRTRRSCCRCNHPRSSTLCTLQRKRHRRNLSHTGRLHTRHRRSRRCRHLRNYLVYTFCRIPLLGTSVRMHCRLNILARLYFFEINKIMSGHFVERHLGKHVSGMRTHKEMPPHGMPALTFIANASRSTQVPFAPFCASVTFALKATLRRSITFHCTFFHSRIAITGWGRCADIIQELSSAYRAANVLFQSIV